MAGCQPIGGGVFRSPLSAGGASMSGILCASCHATRPPRRGVPVSSELPGSGGSSASFINASKEVSQMRAILVPGLTGARPGVISIPLRS